MTRCATTRLLFAVAVVHLLAGEPARSEEAPRPNVLFLFADDQQAATIAALGNRQIRTPNLDRLVRRGLSFDRAYMQGGLNGATCVPSRAMLLSGQSLFRIDEKLLRDPTWPAAFAAAGYTTFLTGKWHNGPASLPRVFQRARGVFAGGMTNPLKARLSNLDDGRLTPPQVAAKHACALFADEAVGFLREKHDRPFFCYLAFDGPHDPHIVPQDFPVTYDAETIPLPANFRPQHPFNNGEMTIRDETLLPWPRDPKAIRGMLAEYYRYITYLDAQIGRVLDALDASPHAKNTLVVFAADSGVARGQHGLIGKQNCYEHSLRVPLIVAGPGIPADARTQAMCYLFDVLPTLGSLCRVAGPKTSEGIDLSAVLVNPARQGKAPPAKARPHLAFAYQKVQRAYRDDRWKIIRYPQIDTTQLFDLQADPDESHDLAAFPEHAPRIRTMLDAMAVELKSFGDSLPLSVEKPDPAAWVPPPKPKILQNPPKKSD
jgi:arylsulfatase A-like enzyme